MVYKISDTHEEYDNKRFSWRQCRDCLRGSDAIKRANEIYLPMPSGMLLIDNPAEQSGSINQSGQNRSAAVSADYGRQFLPWWHPNPAYRAYLMRARFPDITANTLRGLLGISTKADPEIDLPDKISYLVETATPNGFSLRQLYSYCVSEIFSVGKLSLVVDVDDSTNQLFISTYSAESNTDWEYKIINGRRVLTRCVFYQGKTSNGKEEYLEYQIINNNAYVNKYLDNNLENAKLLTLQGRPLTRLPIVHLGSIENTAEPDVVPLLGLTDIALTIYRENADLSQGHFLTCNPTLFIFGAQDEEKPKVIGSSVCVSISNPQGRVEYTRTDTTAFEHIREVINDLHREAVAFGAAFFGENRDKQSGEALKLKQASNGATLIHVVNMVGEGLKDAIEIILEWTNDSSEFVFEANTEFAEVELSSQDISALVASWTAGAIDHDTLLDNFRDANIIESSRTNEEIKQAIFSESPNVDDTNETDVENNGEDTGSNGE